MRVVQPIGTKGSLRWIQQAIAHRPEVLQPANLPKITWVSPVAGDEYAEYSDGDFLERINCGHLRGDLKTFWPIRGPQWDALGVFSGGCVLVEAKAHLAEFISPPCKAGPVSRQKIDTALRAVSEDLGVVQRHDWAEKYYQYSNRLAHLWWLRQRGIHAHLLFVGFVGDRDMNGPEKADEWAQAFRVADAHLGIAPVHKLSRFIHHLSPTAG